MQEQGFRVKSVNTESLGFYKYKGHVPKDLMACHTSFVDGYVLEGHVPAADIKKMLTQKPDIRGLAVPGMPMGSPGMDHGRKQPFETISYTEEGEAKVFASH